MTQGQQGGILSEANDAIDTAIDELQSIKTAVVQGGERVGGAGVDFTGDVADRFLNLFNALGQAVVSIAKAGAGTVTGGGGGGQQ